MALILPFTFSRSSWVETFDSPDGTRVDVRRNMITVKFDQDAGGVAARGSEFEFDLEETFRLNGLANGALTLIVTPTCLVGDTDLTVSTDYNVGSGSATSATYKPRSKVMTFSNGKGTKRAFSSYYEHVRTFPTRGKVQISVDNPLNVIAFYQLEMSFYDHYIDNTSTSILGVVF